MLLKTKSLKDITLSDLISKGGEGEVFNIKLNKASCAKIYHTQFRTKEREDKLKYMVANPPKELKGSYFKICWPEEILYEKGKFVGFMMSKAFDHSKLPYHLCQPKIPKNLEARWHAVFARDTKAGKLARMKLCVNIAAAISRIHEAKKYVLVDFKPQNILVSIDGRISIIDLDSCQINEGSKLIFSAPVSTPEYTPVEASTVNFGKDVIKQSWDVFSFAIMMYEVLCGIHPFVGTANPPNDSYTTIQDKIKNGISHVLIGKSKFQVLPPPHKEYDNLGKDLKELLSHAFGSELQRPQIKDFGETCFKIIQNFNKYLEEENKRRIEADKKIAVQQFPVLKRENEKLKKEINQHKSTIENLKKQAPVKVESGEGVPPDSNSIGYIITIIIIAIVCVISVAKCNQNENDLENSEYRINQINEGKESLESDNERLKTKNRNLRNDISILKSEKNQFRDQVAELEAKFSNNNIIEVKDVLIGSYDEDKREWKKDPKTFSTSIAFDDMYSLLLWLHLKTLRKEKTVLKIKIISHVSMLTNGNSEEYTYEEFIDLKEIDDSRYHSIKIGWWDNLTDYYGNKKSKGNHRLEVWESNKKLFSKEFEITD